ncbi:MAG TPA: hypothetical protein VHB25_08730 [Gemmatimonadaceae bacterium]|nr:hypothetical protein [Gemmatimonadaceae bacterium]
MIEPHQPADSTQTRRIDGRVVRGTRAGQEPVANQWVLVHRVGPDRQGPVDSTRTNAAGRFSIRYPVTGDSTAIYFASTSFDGIAYFTAPLRAPVVSGDDATITVFDTTSGPVAIKVGGRHLVIGAPQPNGRRPVGEVYDLQNDSTVTAVARDSVTPVWSVHIPAQAVDFQLNTSGDIAAGAVRHAGSAVGLFAPLSPGIRQFAFTYELPSDAFPLAVPMERNTGVMEVLVQEPTAKVSGAKLREVAPVSAEGRTFRRFLGQDLGASTVLQIAEPHVVGPEREKVYVGVGIAVLAAMLAALVFAARRPRLRARPVRPAPAEPRSQVLVRTLATLDESFEQTPAPDAATRADYEARRASLKRELADALAAERRSP